MDYLSNALFSGLQMCHEGGGSTALPIKSDMEQQIFPPPNRSDTRELLRTREMEGNAPATKKQVDRRKSSVSRAKTRYRFALPPPATKHHQRIHLRPKLLLQIQQFSKVNRPEPYLDLLPSHSQLPHLPVRFSRQGKGKSHVASDDLVIAHSLARYDYSTAPKHRTSKQNHEYPEIVGKICQPNLDTRPSQSTSILMDDGSEWLTSRLPSGAYEFVTNGGPGLRQVSRWVPKQKSVNRRRIVEDDESSGVLQVTDFNFSILDPHARRHAVIAHLSPQDIEVYDQYLNPPPLTPTNSGNSYTDGLERASPAGEAGIGRATKTVDSGLESFIIVSGIWVALAENFWHIPGHDGKFSQQLDNRGINDSKHSLELSPIHDRNIASHSWPKDETANVRAFARRSVPSSPMPNFHIPAFSGNGQRNPTKAGTGQPTDNRISPIRSRSNLESASENFDPQELPKDQMVRSQDREPMAKPTLSPQRRSQEVRNQDVVTERKGLLRSLNLHSRKKSR